MTGTGAAEADGAASDPAWARALVAEACTRSALLWVSVGGGRPVPAWHAWAEGAAYVVHGGGEQPLEDLVPDADRAVVTVRSKDKGGRLVTWVARVQDEEPGTARYDAAVAALVSERLNARDLAGQAQRWREASRVTRLEPTGELLEQPGAMPDGSLAAPPAPTGATTRGPLPTVLGRARRLRRLRGRT